MKPPSADPTGAPVLILTRIVYTRMAGRSIWRRFAYRGDRYKYRASMHPSTIKQIGQSLSTFIRKPCSFHFSSCPPLSAAAGRREFSGEKTTEATILPLPAGQTFSGLAPVRTVRGNPSSKSRMDKTVLKIVNLKKTYFDFNHIASVTALEKVNSKFMKMNSSLGGSSVAGNRRCYTFLPGS